MTFTIHSARYKIMPKEYINILDKYNSKKLPFEDKYSPEKYEITISSLWDFMELESWLDKVSEYELGGLILHKNEIIIYDGYLE